MTRFAQVQCTLYSTVAELEEWFDKAPAGARQLYARGPSLDPRHEVVRLVNEWRATGEVTPVQGREAVTRQLLYYVDRCRPQPADGAPRRVTVDDEWRETAEGRIFLHLVRLANRPWPCPTNAELAKIGGLRDADAARYVLYQKLQASGRIEIIGNPLGGRQVRIVETGRMTAEARV